MGPKCLIWVFFGVKFLKFLPYWKSAQICRNEKFRAKIKILEFGNKKALFGYFRLKFEKKNVAIFEISTL